MDKVDVIIPVLNEESTLGPIVKMFNRHPGIRTVNVMIDVHSIDASVEVARRAGAYVYTPIRHGKGDLVKYAYQHCNLTDRVILCDGDYQGFSSRGIDMVLMTPGGAHMQIVYPRMPSDEEWRESGMPHLPFWAYPWMAMSGFRCVPSFLLDGENLHGYLIETQLNNAALRKGISIGFAGCDDIIAPLRFTTQRMTAMEEDRAWGIIHGVFAHGVYSEPL